MTDNTATGSQNTGLETRQDQFNLADDQLNLEAAKKLRHENAKYRVRAKDALAENEQMKAQLAEYEAMKKTQAEEDGKFKELYETAQTELNTHKDILEKNKQRLTSLEERYTSEYDELRNGLPEADVKLLDDMPSGMAIEQKLALARKFNTKLQTAPESPASQRPGGDIISDDDKKIKDFIGEKDPKKRAELLYEAKDKSPALYQTFLKLK